MSDDKNSNVVDISSRFQGRASPEEPEYKGVIAKADAMLLDALEDFEGYLSPCLEQLNYNHALMLQRHSADNDTGTGKLRGIFMPLLVTMQKGAWTLFVEQHTEYLRAHRPRKLAKIYTGAHKHGGAYYKTGEAPSEDVIRAVEKALSDDLIMQVRAYHVLFSKLQETMPDLKLKPMLLEHDDDMVSPSIYAQVKKGVEKDIRDIIKDYIEPNQTPHGYLQLVDNSHDQDEPSPR